MLTPDLCTIVFKSSTGFIQIGDGQMIIFLSNQPELWYSVYASSERLCQIDANCGNRQCLIWHKVQVAQTKDTWFHKKWQVDWKAFFEHIWDGRMYFYWICTLCHWDHDSFDLILNALKLDLLDTSPRLCKPRPAWSWPYLLRVYLPCGRRVVLGKMSCCV